MNGSRMVIWSIIILAELLAISLGLNIFSLWRGRRARRGSLPPPLIQLGEAVAHKAQEINDAYRRIIGEAEEDVWSLMKDLQAKEKELEELLQPALAKEETVRDTPYATLLRSLGNHLRESHELVTTAMQQRFERTHLLQELKERMMAQERLLQELKELIVAYLAELEALLEGLREGQLDPEALAQLKQRYQLAQGKLQELEGNKHVLLAKGEPSRSLSETLRTLKEEKGQLEREVERLKGLERAYVQVQLEATRLEDQLHHSNDEMQQLRSKHDQLTKQYIRAFGGRKP